MVVNYARSESVDKLLTNKLTASVEDADWGLLVDLKVLHSIECVYMGLCELVLDPTDTDVGLGLRVARSFQLIIVSGAGNLHVESLDILALAVGD